VKPFRTQYDVGTTRFGQRLTLEEDAAGFTLVQHAANQRDETQRVYITHILAAAIMAALS